MVAHVGASDWSTTRGEAWRDSMHPLEAMLAPVNDPLMTALQLDAPLRIADIGCGGGETSFAVAEYAPKGSQVAGYDISPALIEAARSKAAASVLPVEFHVADAQAPAPFVAQYDRMTSRFGVMFFDDADLAFRNLSQWLKPGGRFAFAVWGPPPNNPWMTSIRTVLQHHIELPAPDPQAPGPFRYQDAPSFLTLLRMSGFNDLQYQTWSNQLDVGGGLAAEDAADFALSAFSIGQQLSEGDHATALAARSDLVAAFAQHEADGRVRMDAQVHIVTGRRSET